MKIKVLQARNKSYNGKVLDLGVLRSYDGYEVFDITFNKKQYIGYIYDRPKEGEFHCSIQLATKGNPINFDRCICIQ